MVKLDDLTTLIVPEEAGGNNSKMMARGLGNIIDKKPLGVLA